MLHIGNIRYAFISICMQEMARRTKNTYKYASMKTEQGGFMVRGHLHFSWQNYSIAWMEKTATA